MLISAQTSRSEFSGSALSLFAGSRKTPDVRLRSRFCALDIPRNLQIPAFFRVLFE